MENLFTGNDNFEASSMSENDLLNLFSDNTEEPAGDDTPENKQKENETTDIDPNSLFTDQLESIGGEDDVESQENTFEDEPSNTSPKQFYSSFALALSEEGILSELSEDDLSKVTSATELGELIEKTIDARLSDELKRIKLALDYGIEPSVITQYENTLNVLNKITELELKAETPEAENLRKTVILQDYLNKGFSQERALKEVNKSFNAGTDIEDALEALGENKKHFTTAYQEELENAKLENENRTKSTKETAEKLKKELLDGKLFFNGLELDAKTKQKAYDAITKPIHKEEDGKLYTAVLKYEKDNKVDFMKHVGIIFALTDGFKNLEPLIGKQVKKESRKALASLDQKLKSSNYRGLSGSIELANSLGSDDPESYQGFTLDI